MAKLAIPFLMVLPGMAARLHLPALVAVAPNEAYPAMAAALLPHGLLGVMVAAMVSALMSSLASTFHSTSTVVAYDLYGTWAGGGGGGGHGEGEAAREARLVLVGRLVTVVLMFVGVAWIPIIESVSNQLYVRSGLVGGGVPLRRSRRAEVFFWSRARLGGEGGDGHCPKRRCCACFFHHRISAARCSGSFSAC